MLHGHGIFGPMSKFKKNKKLKTPLDTDFGHVLPLLMSNTVGTTNLKQNKTKQTNKQKKQKQKKKEKKRKAQDFDIWTTPPR